MFLRTCAAPSALVDVGEATGALWVEKNGPADYGSTHIIYILLLLIIIIYYYLFLLLYIIIIYYIYIYYKYIYIHIIFLFLYFEYYGMLWEYIMEYYG